MAYKWDVFHPNEALNFSNYLWPRLNCTNGFKEIRGYCVTYLFSSIAKRIPLGGRS